MNAEQTIQAMQEKINQVTRRLIQSETRQKDAKAQIVHLVNHFDEYSKQRMCGELTSIAEEVLTESETYPTL